KALRVIGRQHSLVDGERRLRAGRRNARTIIVKVDEGTDLFAVRVGARRREMELGDVAPFVRIDPRNLQPIHWAAGSDVDSGDVIEPSDGDNVGPESANDDVNVPCDIIGAIGGDGGRNSRLAGQRKAGNGRGSSRAAIPEVQALLVALNVEGA